MNILIIDNNSSFIDNLSNILTLHSLKIVKFEDFKFAHTEGYDLIILSGGHPNSVEYEHKLFEEELKTILRADIPVLGICLGFELIVYAFGGKLKELPEKEKGILEIKFIKNDPIFKGVKKLNVFESHRWVADQLPDVLIPLATSKDGVEIVKHSTRFIYGFQFHPEIIEDKNDIKIFNNLLGLAEK